MRAQGKPCVAFGGEIGDMTPRVRRAVCDLCGDVFFMARSAASYEKASALGLEARRGADTAWTFDSSRGRQRAAELLLGGGWDGGWSLLGIAPVNPYWWPVKPFLWKWALRILVALDFARDNRGELSGRIAERRVELVSLLDDMTEWLVDYLRDTMGLVVPPQA